MPRPPLLDPHVDRHRSVVRQSVCVYLHWMSTGRKNGTNTKRARIRHVTRHSPPHYEYSNICHIMGKNNTSFFVSVLCVSSVPQVFCRFCTGCILYSVRGGTRILFFEGHSPMNTYVYKNESTRYLLQAGIRISKINGALFHRDHPCFLRQGVHTHTIG